MDPRLSIILGMSASLPPSDYQSLAEFRHQIRRFLRFSEQAARKSGLTPRQHQMLLAIKGMPPRERPRIGTVAERLQIRHHSAVELANRLTKKGMVRRVRDGRGGNDRREVLLSLTAKGERVLRNLSVDHWEELGTAGPRLMKALKRVLQDAPSV